MPPTAESSSTPLPEDKYHGWIDLNSNQLLQLHAWHIPQNAMDHYMKQHYEDPEVYVDFTTYYRENELGDVQLALERMRSSGALRSAEAAEAREEEALILAELKRIG